jgi:5-formyltetrahydrofolate cyclo-ligase
MTAAARIAVGDASLVVSKRPTRGDTVPEIDPETLEAIIVRAKRQVRTRMRSLRLALPESAVAQRSRAIVERVSAHPAFVEARGIALFWPIEQNREVDLRPLDALARAAGKAVHYPFMEPKGEIVKTGFRRVDDPAELAVRGMRFAEPPLDAPEAVRGDVDLVLVPALAVDASGYRVGYGAGFYDATLPDIRPPALAAVVAFDFQLLAEAPRAGSDVGCDLVITDLRLIEASR